MCVSLRVFVFVVVVLRTHVCGVEWRWGLEERGSYKQRQEGVDGGGRGVSLCRE